MTLKEAMKRIEALEQKVRELESRPTQVHHYHYQNPLVGGQPIWQYIPPSYPSITWGGVGNTSVATTTIRSGSVPSSDGLQWSY